VILNSIINGKLKLWLLQLSVTPYVVFQHQQVTACTKLCCPYHHKTTAIGPHHSSSRRISAGYTSSVTHPIWACSCNIQGADHSWTEQPARISSSHVSTRKLRSDGRGLLQVNRVKLTELRLTSLLPFRTRTLEQSSTTFDNWSFKFHNFQTTSKDWTVYYIFSDPRLFHTCESSLRERINVQY